MNYLLLFVLFINNFFLTQFNPATKNTQPNKPSPSPIVVCLDPGHGGEDSGAIYGDLTEEAVVLDIAYRLKTLLEQNQYQVIMTRTDHKTSLTNSQRAAICNTHQANVLVSIHLNYNDDPTLDYTEGLYGNSKDFLFTQYMHNALVSSLQLPDGETTDFENNALLKMANPATLQETVFISSSQEYQQLTDGSGRRQQQITQALFEGINGWFKKASEKVSTGSGKNPEKIPVE